MTLSESKEKVESSDSDLFDKEYRYALLQVASGKFNNSYNNLSNQEQREAGEIALKQCEIQHRILSSDEAAKVIIPSQRIAQEVETIVSRYPDKLVFERELLENNLTLEGFPLLVERSLKVEAVMDFVASRAEVCSEINARLYYYMNTEKFKLPEFRKARHILITVNEDFPENFRDEVIKRLDVIAKRLKNKPSRFSEQAQKYSECPTAMNGGELGTLKRGVLFPSLDKELFSMKVGQVSDIVESPMGFHVLFCEEIQKEGYVSLSKVLPEIIEKLTEKNRITYQRKWLKTLFEAH